MPGFVSILLLVLLHLGASTLARADRHSLTKADGKAYGWCISHFLSLDEEDPQSEQEIRPIARPPEKFRPLDTENMLIPPDLIRETEIVGNLPPKIERHQGVWILPAIDTPSPSVIFVERLTPTEMTIVVVRKSYPTNTDNPRSTLKWDGQVFRGVRGEFGHDVVISADGEAMLLIAVSPWEAMPVGCFISSKHY